MIIASGLAGSILLGGDRADAVEISKHNIALVKRTFEAFEGRANAELVERAFSDRDLDK